MWSSLPLGLLSSASVGRCYYLIIRLLVGEQRLEGAGFEQIIIREMENHGGLQPSELVLKKEEAYLTLLKKRGGYLGRHLRKIENDFLKKYGERTTCERTFLSDVKIMFDIYNVLVGEILMDLEFTELEEFGQGIQKLFQQIIMIVNYLIESFFIKVINPSEDAKPLLPVNVPVKDENQQSNQKVENESKPVQQKNKKHYEQNQKLLYSIREETRLYDMPDSGEDQLHRMQQEVLRNKNECLRIRESPLESNLKQAYDYLIQHSIYSRNFLERAERRFKEVGSDIANMEYNKENFFQGEEEVKERKQMRARKTCVMINQFKKAAWVDVATQTDNYGGHNARRSTCSNGFAETKLLRKNTDCADKVKADNAVLTADIQTLKKKLKEEQDLRQQYQQKLQRELDRQEQLQDTIEEYKACVKNRERTIGGLQEGLSSAQANLRRTTQHAVELKRQIDNLEGMVDLPAVSAKTISQSINIIDRQESSKKIHSILRKKDKCESRTRFKDDEQDQQRREEQHSVQIAVDDLCDASGECPSLFRKRARGSDRHIRSKQHISAVIYGTTECATSTSEIPPPPPQALFFPERRTQPTPPPQQPLVISEAPAPVIAQAAPVLQKKFTKVTECNKDPNLTVILEEKTQHFISCAVLSKPSKKAPSLRCLQSSQSSNNPSPLASCTTAKHLSQVPVKGSCMVQTDLSQNNSYMINGKMLRQYVHSQADWAKLDQALRSLECMNTKNTDSIIEDLLHQTKKAKKRREDSLLDDAHRHLRSQSSDTFSRSKHGSKSAVPGRASGQVFGYEVGIQCAVIGTSRPKSDSFSNIEVLPLYQPLYRHQDSANTMLRVQKVAERSLSRASSSCGSGLHTMLSRLKEQKNRYYKYPVEHLTLPSEDIGSFVNLMPDSDLSAPSLLRKPQTSSSTRRRKHYRNVPSSNQGSKFKLIGDLYRKLSDNRTNNHALFFEMVNKLNLSKTELRSVLSYDEFSLAVSKFLDRHTRCQRDTELCSHVAALLH